MKLQEVSTGKSTLAFADYIQHMKDIGVSPKIIGELSSIGTNCIKNGGEFDSSDEDDVRINFQYCFIEMPPIVESKAFFRHRVAVTFDRGQDPSPHVALGRTYRAYSIEGAAKARLGDLMAIIHKMMELQIEASRQVMN